MNLPNRENAYVPPQKIHEYLLSELHPIGKFKARFFHAIGYSDPADMEKSLLAHAQTGEVKEIIPSAYGTKYVLEGTIRTPSGQLVRLHTVWIVEKNDVKPKFITAYPG